MLPPYCHCKPTARVLRCQYFPRRFVCAADIIIKKEDNAMINTKSVEDDIVYYVTRCAPSDYNPQLLAAYLNLFGELQGLPTPETLELPDSGTHKIHIPPTVTYHRNIAATGIAVAACIATLFVGSLGSAAEHKHNGFFYWISRGKDGTSFVTVPNLDDSTTSISSIHYECTDVPAEYQQYVVDVSDFNFLDGFVSEGAEVFIGNGNGDGDSVHSVFRNSITNNVMMIAVTIYPHDRSVSISGGHDDLADYQSYGYYIDGNNTEYDLLSKTNSHGGMDYVVVFYYGDKKYQISYVDDLPLLLEAARSFYRNLCLK